jgi:type VI protein secretion system component VasK
MAALGSSDNKKGGLRRSGDDAVQITIDYLKQETLGPLKGLGKFLAWGVSGSVALAIGVMLLLIGVLRLLQSETGSALRGDWSWVPYLGVTVLGLAVIGLAAWRITAGPATRKLPQLEAARQSDEAKVGTEEG